jgi:hypothetical protein
MNHTWRLLISVGLAVAAAFGNHTYLQSRLRCEQFVAAGRGLKLGMKVTAEDLQPVSLSGDVAELKHVLVSWERRDEIIGRQVPREIAQHEILTLSTFMHAARQAIPAGRLGIFVPTDGLATVPPFLRPDMVVYFAIQRAPTSKTDDPSEEPRMIGPFTITAVDGATNPDVQLELTSNRRPVLTIAASPDELKQLEIYRLLQNAVARNGWKLLTLTVFTPASSAL